MKSRICMLLGSIGEKVTAQTFHSFCANVLRKYAPLVGIQSNYTIIDAEDSKTIIDDIIDKIIEDEKKKMTNKKYGKVRGDFPTANKFISMLTFIRIVIKQ